MNKQELGRWGEEEAAKWLVYKNFEILERNWRHGKLELDLIAKKGRQIVFVEVKSRSSNKFEFPEDAVTAAKQKLMLKAANAYCHVVSHDGPVRFDIITLEMSDFGKKLRHTEDAFYPMGE